MGGVMIHSTVPFEHWIIDDFLPTEMAQAARDHFHEGTGEWIKRHHLYSRNKQTRTAGLSEPAEQALQALECPGMLAYVSALTGIKGLHADSMRFGGGQHVTTRGGSLGIHADFTHHPQTGMRRALNVLLYLNECESGGLELWDARVQQRKQLVMPKFNRAVIFKTSVTSFHGHPEPLAESERLSLAVYYYIDTDSFIPSPCCKAPWHSVCGTCAADWDHDCKLKEYTGYLKTTDYRPRPWEYKLRLRKWLSKMVKG